MEINKTLIHRLKKQEKQFVFKHVEGQEHLNELMSINQSVIDEQIDKSIFAPPSEDELKVSLDLDKVIVVYHDNKPIAFSILMVCRDDERDLGRLSDHCEVNDCLTFDNVLVLKEYRGYGIEKELIKLAKDYQKRHNIKYLLAVVSKINIASFK